MRETKVKKKQEKAITLIVLVITIIVLLILAGVSIATLTGQNGILNQSNSAKIEQSHGAVKEAIALAYNEWQIELNTVSSNKQKNDNLINDENQKYTRIASEDKIMISGKENKFTATTSVTFLNFLKDKKYIKENTENIIDVEKLTGGKQALGNGTDNDIYVMEEQEENYVVVYIDNANKRQEIWTMVKEEGNNIKLDIVKVPENENEKVGSVVLKCIVTQDGIQVPGYEIEKLNEQEYKNKLLEELQKIDEPQKEDLFVELFNITEGTNFKNIDEVIKYLADSKKISEDSKDAFYNELFGGKENFDSQLSDGIYNIEYNLIGEYNKETGELKKYKIKNPNGENTDVYVATKNGSYTFTAEINGKEYTKTVDINNIEGEITLNYTVEIDNNNTVNMVLVNMDTKEYTTFENAYVIENGNIIDVTNIIQSDNSSYEYNYVFRGDLHITLGLKDIILKKDNIYYCGKVEVVIPK